MWFLSLSPTSTNQKFSQCLQHLGVAPRCLRDRDREIAFVRLSWSLLTEVLNLTRHGLVVSLFQVSRLCKWNDRLCTLLTSWWVLKICLAKVGTQGRFSQRFSFSILPKKTSASMHMTQSEIGRYHFSSLSWTVLWADGEDACCRLEEKKACRRQGRSGRASLGIWLHFWVIFNLHTPPPPPPPLKKQRVAETTHKLRNRASCSKC